MTARSIEAARAAREEIASRPTIEFTCRQGQHGSVLVYAMEAEAWCPCGRMVRLPQERKEQGR